MLEIHKELTLHLYLLVIAHPRLAVGTLLLFFSGTVAIRAIARGNKAKQHTMADPKTPTPTPVTRSSSSSSSSSSDLLIPTHAIIPQGEPPKRSSSWPAPVPWRSSWEFLEQPAQGHVQELLEQEQEEIQQQAHPSSVRVLPTSNTHHFLMLPSGVRRTGSMEARKGSACAFPEVDGGDGILRFGEERGLNRGVFGLYPGAGGGSDEGGGGTDGDRNGNGNYGSVLVGVGGQFP